MLSPTNLRFHSTQDILSCGHATSTNRESDSPTCSKAAANFGFLCTIDDIQVDSFSHSHRTFSNKKKRKNVPVLEPLFFWKKKGKNHFTKKRARFGAPFFLVKKKGKNHFTKIIFVAPFRHFNKVASIIPHILQT